MQVCVWGAGVHPCGSLVHAYLTHTRTPRTHAYRTTRGLLTSLCLARQTARRVWRRTCSGTSWRGHSARRRRRSSRATRRRRPRSTSTSSRTARGYVAPSAGGEGTWCLPPGGRCEGERGYVSRPVAEWGRRRRESPDSSNRLHGCVTAPLPRRMGGDGGRGG